MKKSPSNQDDEFFRRQFGKMNNELSEKDRALFLESIEALPRKIDKKYKHAYLSFSITEKPTSSSSVIHAENINLFKDWIENNLSYIPSKTSDRPHPPPSPQKKSSLPIPTIDLHGYTRQEALHQLKFFLLHLPPHTRKARIIHGKGLSKGQPSVVRQDIREWLSHQRKYNSWLSDFSYEIPKNGGHGATIIWIKPGECYGKN